MTAKRTLQSFLSPAVELLHHAPDEAEAEVVGSHPYRVELGLKGKKLEADCTCPAMEDFGFCKHAVAFGLFLIDAPASSNKKKAKENNAADEFSKRFPNIAGWVVPCEESDFKLI